MAEMEFLDDKDFFRMSRATFNRLLEIIRNTLQISPRGKVNAMNSSGSCIDAITKLAVTILWLAGGAAIDISQCISPLSS